MLLSLVVDLLLVGVVVDVGQQVEQCSEDDLDYTGTAATSLDILAATKFDLSPINLNQW